MIVRNEILLAINNDELKEEELVSIFELIVFKLGITTISDQAKKDNKTYRGILMSNCYKKIDVAGKTFVVPGIRDDKMPF